MQRIVVVGLTCLFAVLPSFCLAQPATSDPAVTAFIDEMVGKHGFDRATLAKTFGKIQFLPRIVSLMDKQSKPLSWNEYRARFVTREKLDRGARFWEEHERALALASDRYGVPPEVIVAILGVETHYGKNSGRFNVLEALTTLAFNYPRRSQLFRLELEQFLLLGLEEPLMLNDPVGSYAGAMGIAQFMPGSYRRYAVDFDGDGKRDLFGNPSDAIGSVANYLTAYGWQRDAPIAVAASVKSGADKTFANAELSTRLSLEELSGLGITARGAFDQSRSSIPLTLRNPAGPEYWLGFDNFYVITRYNHSVYYAMAVYQLSDELRKHWNGPRETASP